MSDTERILAWSRVRRCFAGIVLAAGLASNACGHGDLDIRIAAATRGIEKDTNNASLYVQRGELHREHKDWPAAMADYDRAAMLDPKLVTVEFYRGRMLADAEKLDEALKALVAYVAKNPADGNGFVEMARVKDHQGKHAEAVADYSRGLELLREPEPELFLERAQALLAEGETNRAIASLDEGVKKLGPVVTLQLCGTELEVAQKRYEAAIARLNTIIPQANRKENWLMRRGEIELMAGKTKAAQESFEASLRAIDILPARLQLNRPMVELRARVNQALVTTTNTTPKATTK